MTGQRSEVASCSVDRSKADSSGQSTSASTARAGLGTLKGAPAARSGLTLRGCGSGCPQGIAQEVGLGLCLLPLPVHLSPPCPSRQAGSPWAKTALRQSPHLQAWRVTPLPELQSRSRHHPNTTALS